MMKTRLICVVLLCAVGQALATLYFYTGKKPTIDFSDLLALSRKALQQAVPQHSDYNPIRASLYGMQAKDSGRWNIIFVNTNQRSYNVNTLFPERQTTVVLYSSNDLYNIYVDTDMATAYARALAMLTQSQQSEYYCCGAGYDTNAGAFRFYFASATNWKTHLIVDNHSVTNRTH